MKRVAWVLALGALLLAACGPSGCENPGPPSLPAGAYADELDKLLALTNEARAHGRPCGNACLSAAAPLTRNRLLDTAAGKHASDMAATGVFSHETPPDAPSGYKEGTDPGGRIAEEGYNWQSYGENIAKGQPDAQTVIAAWLDSPEHCTNIMNPGFEEIGLGMAEDSEGVIYWVQDFATPK